MQKRLPPLALLLIPASIFAVLLWVSKWVVLERHSGASGTNVVQITTSPGLHLYPSFSPDGANIAYSSDRSGRFEIYVQPLTSGAGEVRITSDGEQNAEPAWSPDGQNIAYMSELRKGIFVVPATGGTPQRMTRFGTHPSWSPDGAKIAFAAANIWIVSAEGGQPRPVTQADHPAGDHVDPSWSSDGMSILFSTRSTGGSDVWSVRVREGAVSAVSKRNGSRFSPVYTPDGRSVLYVLATENGFAVGKTSLSDGRSYEILPLGATVPRGLTIDRTGRRLAYSTGNIYIAELPR